MHMCMHKLILLQGFVSILSKPGDPSNPNAWGLGS